VPRPTLRTADDVALAGRRLLVPGEPSAAVVVVHGFSASAACPHVERVALGLHGLDLDVVTYDARGHGGSGGVSTLGDLERHDVAAAVELARRRTDTVVLVGASMGAIAVLRHAASDAALAGVVTISCPARFRLPFNARAFLAAGMTRTPIGRALMTRTTGVRVARRWESPEPPAALVPRVDAPIAFVHGTDDRFIPSTDSVALHEVANEPRSLTVVRGMGHAFDEAGVPAILSSVMWTLAHADAGDARHGAEDVPALS
jgi:alpha-beta hydrolase superfamily lysophospholipase